MSYEKNLRQVIISTAAGNNAAGDNTIVAGGQLGTGIGSIKVYQLVLNSSGANVITPKSNATIIGNQLVHTGAGASTTEQNTEAEWMKTLPGQSLVLNFTAGSTTSGVLYYALA